jgi:DNA-binding GntR family transcriptional regulator
MTRSRPSRLSGPERAGRATEVYHELRELIVHGRIAPGARITEIEAAERLGVSRTPLRAALQRLQQEGYIVAPANGRRARTFVAPLTREDSTELMHIIGEMEGLAARNAAGLNARLRTGLVEEMTALNEKLARATAAARPHAATIFELDLAFHSAFVVAGAGPRLLALHQATKPQAERYGRVYAAALTGAMALSVREHMEIVGAIGQADADGAQRAVLANWRNAAARLSQVIEEAGERGNWSV